MTKKKAAKKTAAKRPVKKAAKKADKKAAKKPIKSPAKKAAASKGGRPKGSGKLPASPDHAPTLRALAGQLTRDLASIQAWNREAGNPGRDDTGQFHVPSWIDWMASTGKNFKDTSDSGKTARARKAEVDAQIQELKLRQLQGESANIEEVEEVVGGLLGDLKQELMAFGQQHSERLAGQDQGKLEKIVDERMRELLERLSIPDEKKKTGDSRQFWTRLCERLFPLRI